MRSLKKVLVYFWRWFIGMDIKEEDRRRDEFFLMRIPWGDDKVLRSRLFVASNAVHYLKKNPYGGKKWKGSL